MKITEPAREAFLYRIWQKKDIESQTIHTINGQEIIIREKGVRNFDSGPDFLNALIEYQGEIKRGDVEIHPIAGDWYAHGHHRDPRYDQVILHIVTMDCPADFRTKSLNGTHIPTINLDSLLETKAEDLEKQHNFDQDSISGECALSLCSSLQIQSVLEKAGIARFLVHAQQFSEQSMSNSWDQICYRSLLEALGYAKNQVAFRNLADHLHVEILWKHIWQDVPSLAVLKCEAYLMGTAGLLPSQSVVPVNIFDAEILEYTRKLETTWQEFPYRKKLFVLKAEMWKFFRLRPQNFPTRRIGAAARLVVRFLEDGFVDSFFKVLQRNENQLKAVYKELEELFDVKEQGFWAEHYLFEPVKKSNAHALLGKDRIRDILVNVIFPVMYAYAKEVDDHKSQNLILELYKNYPCLAENHLIRNVKKRVLKMQTQHKLVNNACVQQGIIHLGKIFCEPQACRQCLDGGVSYQQSAGN